jgi:ribose transport system permease protein
MSNDTPERPKTPRFPKGLAAASPLRIFRTTARSRIADYGIVILLVALLVLGRVVYDGFFTTANLTSILSQSAPLGIVAVGMTFVIVGGGFDLSVGAVFAIGATVFAAMGETQSWLLSAGVAVAIGLALGALNGLIVTAWSVNPFIATLGTSSIFGGGILLLTNNKSFVLTRFGELGAGAVGGIPISVIVLIALLVAGYILLRMTVYGRAVYAVGGSEHAAHLAGLRVKLTRASTYVLSGSLAAFAGVMQASRLGSGQGNMGDTIALNAIAVVVIGGTALLGGEGSIWRTAVGLLIIGILNNVFFSLALSGNWQTIITGVILISAVAFDVIVRRGRRS